MENYIHIPGFWYVLVYIRGALVCVGINGKLYTHPKCFCIRWYEWKIISLTKSEEFWYEPKNISQKKTDKNFYTWYACVGMNGKLYSHPKCFGISWYKWKIISLVCVGISKKIHA